MNRTSEVKVLELVDTLHSLLLNFVYYLPLIFFLLGFVGFVGNTITYLQPELRTSTCCVYSFCGSIVDICHLSLNAIPEYLSAKHGIRWAWEESTFSCKILYFLYVCLPNLSGNFLIMSAIDRYACTCSLTSKIHRLNQMKLLPWTISLTIFISCLSSIYAPIIVYLGSSKYCSFSNTKIFSSFNLIMNGLIPTSLMLIFVLLTYFNIRSSRQRVATISTASNSNRFKNQFIALIITQVVVTAIITYQWMTVLMFLMTTGSQSRSVEQTYLLFFVMTLSAYFYYANNIKSFYLSLLTSRVFREKFFAAFRRRHFHFPCWF